MAVNAWSWDWNIAEENKLSLFASWGSVKECFVSILNCLLNTKKVDPDLVNRPFSLLKGSLIVNILLLV